MESKKEIKYKHSEGNKNIKNEDELLTQLEQLKNENKYEECIFRKKLFKRK